MAKRRLIVEPDKYVLLFNGAYTDYDGVEPVEIGKIVDTTTQKDVLYIYYNKNNYAENGYHVNIDVYEDENGEYPVANVDDMHRPCMFTTHLNAAKPVLLDLLICQPGLVQITVNIVPVLMEHY